MLWLRATGIKNAGYIILFAGAILFGLKFIAGIFFGIFIYVNFNVIQKLIRDIINRDNHE